MRKSFGVWLLAVVGIAGVSTPLQAGHCGICRYPKPCVTPEQCCPAVVTSVVQYQPVVEKHEQVCYRPVYKTCYQPETYTTYRTVQETTCVAEKYTVQRPVTEYFDTVRTYTVQRPVYETCYQTQTYTVCRPVTRTFQVAIPYCTQRPVYETYYREVPYTVCRSCGEYTVAIPYCTQRPVYEQHVRTQCYTVNRRSSKSSRSQCRTRSIGRSTSSTSAIPYTTYRKSTSRIRSRLLHRDEARLRAARPPAVLHDVPHRNAAIPGRGAVHDLPASSGSPVVLVPVTTYRDEVEYVANAREVRRGAGRHRAPLKVCTGA